ncbi:uncharacterized protein BXZ73DRAFT_74957 [Epithele typhae]|uniref:uncharacterized protein n=1 Tax=Epithele typhae TaxID=378194 RepID=UPI002007DAF1|nr:uncharacterized protein BXZ73DRAFT_74957 [Epithele typhae]KAH9941777.1 hypothetical protein BXZ73DRAFT_74957 [Epithele typhae]
MDVFQPSKEDSSCFPTEIEFAIIGKLRLNKATLKLCALVCQRWRYVSQSHLFASISLRCERMADFVAVLDANRTQVGGHLRNISIKGDSATDETPLPLPLFVRLLSHLPNLSDIQIDHCSLEASFPYPPRVELTGGRWRPFSIDNLTFFSCGAPDGSVLPFLWALCLFSRIGSLTITEAHWEDGSVEVVTAEDFNTPAIHTISLESFPEDLDLCLFDLLEVSGSLARHLQELDIFLLRDQAGTPNLLTDIVRHGAQVLTKLKVNLCSLSQSCTFAPSAPPRLPPVTDAPPPLSPAMLDEFMTLDLARLPALQELTLVVQRACWSLNTMTNNRFLGYWLAVWTCFVHTAAPALHTVTFALDAMNEPLGSFCAAVRHALEHEEEHRDVWAALDGAVVARAPALRRVEVFVGRDQNSVKAHVEGPLEELWRMCLPRTWATGVAGFVWFEPWVVNEAVRNAPPPVIVLDEEEEQFGFDGMDEDDDEFSDEDDDMVDGEFQD